MNNKSPVGMAGEDHGGGVAAVVGSNGGGEQSGSGSSSPKNKVKFLCSHGGKVLPRPSDGLLKYVGGETRVISVPRTVDFYEMMKKLNAMIDGAENMVLKYQLVPEDLDALVSVRNDEDLKHMIDEHDRHESGGSPLLRAFLFPSKPVVYVDNHHAAAAASEQYALEQRYIDAINGIIRTSPKGRLSPIRAYCTSSACSSPKSNSPDGHTADFVAVETPLPFHGGSLHSGRLAMNRVRSSPSISSLSNIHGLNNVQQHDHHHHHHSHFHNNQSHHLHPPPPLASSLRTQQQEPSAQGKGRPTPIITSIRGSNGINYYYSPSTSRPPKGYAYYEEVPGGGAGAAYGNVMTERVNSMPPSPGRSIWD